jgi:hypothetical protein
MTDEQKQRVRELVAALRSDEYAQGRGMLRTKEGFCCLGVACDLYGKANGVEWTPPVNQPENFRHWEFLGAWTTLPRDVAGWYGFEYGLGELSDPKIGNLTASQMNDKGSSFAEIADAFERTFLS